MLLQRTAIERWPTWALACAMAGGGCVQSALAACATLARAASACARAANQAAGSGVQAAQAAQPGAQPPPPAAPAPPQPLATSQPELASSSPVMPAHHGLGQTGKATLEVDGHEERLQTENNRWAWLNGGKRASPEWCKVTIDFSVQLNMNPKAWMYV